jgi:hypothetical protein
MQSNALTKGHVDTEQTGEEIRSIFKEVEEDIRQHMTVRESNVGRNINGDIKALFSIHSSGEKLNIRIVSDSDIKIQENGYMIKIRVKGGRTTDRTERVYKKVVDILSKYVDI